MRSEQQQLDDEKSGEDRGVGRSFKSREWVPRQVLLELVYDSNVRFCGLHGTWARSANYFMAPAFAAGMVFVSSIMDRLTCQMLYNEDLVRVSALERRLGGRWEAGLKCVRAAGALSSANQLSSRPALLPCHPGADSLGP